MNRRVSASHGEMNGGPASGGGTSRSRGKEASVELRQCIPPAVVQGALTGGRRWYVARTQPHAESRAKANLEKQGFLTFCPRFRKSRRHARRLESVVVPLFPNYLFVQLDLSRDRWRAINGTRGVARMIMQGDLPQAVAPGVVEALQQRMRIDGTIDMTAKLEIGQSVRVADGPFADLVGRLAQLDSTGRVRVLLSLLGRTVSVALNGAVLLPAE
jgi:transcriptional antiterminator RfaH